MDTPPLAVPVADVDRAPGLLRCATCFTIKDELVVLSERGAYICRRCARAAATVVDATYDARMNSAMQWFGEPLECRCGRETMSVAPNCAMPHAFCRWCMFKYKDNPTNYIACTTCNMNMNVQPGAVGVVSLQAFVEKKFPAMRESDRRAVDVAIGRARERWEARGYAEYARTKNTTNDTDYYVEGHMAPPRPPKDFTPRVDESAVKRLLRFIGGGAVKHN